MSGTPLPPTRLASLLAAGDPVITADVTPPLSTDPARLGEEAEPLGGLVDAVFVTDAPGARPRPGALAAAVYLKERMGLEPVLQVACNRCNRISLQGELLGAALWGIQNLLILGGDPARVGSLPRAVDVGCVDSIELLAIADGMRRKGILEDGRSFQGRSPFLLGGVVDPAGGERETERASAKIAAGADFLVTQPVFDLDSFSSWWEDFRTAAAARVRLLAGVLVLTRGETARYLHRRVPGVSVPTTVVEALSRSPDQREAGIVLAVEITLSLLQLPGLAGIHLMGSGDTRATAEVIRRCGIR
jgi:methylenetetrahydrofolate reductase (NADPH)